MSSPGSYLRRGEHSRFSASMEVEGAELTVPLVASELGAVPREGSDWRVPAHSGIFTLTKNRGGITES